MKNNARRAAGEPLTAEQNHELELLSSMPDEEIDFSDIPEHPYDSLGTSTRADGGLEEHTVTIHVDAEVAAWLKAAAKEDAEHINLMLKHLARRKSPRLERTLLDKAS